MCVAILKGELVTLRSLRRDVPVGLEEIVLRCLAPDPSERFPDVGSLAKALVPFAPPDAGNAPARIRRILQSAQPPDPNGDARSKRSRRRRVRTVAALVATAGLAATAATCLATSGGLSLPRLARDRSHLSAVPLPPPAP